MTNEEILKAVNYLKTLEPTKDVIINFMELARKDERDTLIGRIEGMIRNKYNKEGQIHKNALELVECIATQLNKLREAK